MSLTSGVRLHIHLWNEVVRFIFSFILQIWYVEIRISRSISESPLDFEITRINCNSNRTHLLSAIWLVESNLRIACRLGVDYTCRLWVDMYRDSQVALLHLIPIYLYALIIITKTYLYNFDPLKPHFYLVKLRFTGGIHFFLFLLSHRLWVLIRTASSRRF